jgi:hypothetical protein
MYELCNKKITINGFTFECECDKGHSGRCVARVKMNRMLYDGFDWSVDESGYVTINISPSVAHEIMRWEKEETKNG